MLSSLSPSSLSTLPWRRGSSSLPSSSSTPCPPRCLPSVRDALLAQIFLLSIDRCQSISSTSHQPVTMT
ncbi:unnamed protein product [Penicillium nalgiovense]|nr:unnamed protein product [Penicillium nalgiovense]